MDMAFVTSVSYEYSQYVITSFFFLQVDGDRRNSLSSGGQDSISAAGAHAALLSSANAGTGYMAFA
jgi:hypothetical protein